MDKGIIKKLNTHELVGWEDEALMDVYPITATSAVYDEDTNKSLADILKDLKSGSGSGGSGSGGSGGANPIKTKLLQIYMSSDTMPVTPTGGSYSFTDDTLTVPTGWSGSPDGLASPIWMSYGSVTSNVDGITWSVPVCISGSVVDGILKRCYVAIVYRTMETQPETPTGGSYDFDSGTFIPPDGWSANASKTTTNAEQWCSIRAFYNDDTETSWSTPCKAAEANVTLTAAQLETIAGKIKLTTNDFDMIAGKINLNSDQIDTIAKAVTLTTDDLRVIAANTTLSSTDLAVVAQNVSLTTDQLNTVANNVSLKADQIDTIAKKVTLNADQLEYTVKSLTLNADLIDAVSNKVEEDVDGTLTEYKSEWKKTAEEISAELSATKTDLNGQISKQSATFSATASQLQANLESYQTNVNGQIAGVNSNFTMMADSISSTVSAFTDDVNGRITTQNTEIQQTASKIAAVANQFTYDENGTLTGSRSGNLLVQADKVALEQKIKDAAGNTVDEATVGTMIEDGIAKAVITGNQIKLEAGEHGLLVNGAGAMVVNTPNFSLDSSGNISISGEINATSGSFSGDIKASTLTLKPVTNTSGEIDGSFIPIDGSGRSYKLPTLSNGEVKCIYGSTVISSSSVGVTITASIETFVTVLAFDVKNGTSSCTSLAHTVYMTGPFVDFSIIGACTSSGTYWNFKIWHNGGTISTYI